MKKDTAEYKQLLLRFVELEAKKQQKDGLTASEQEAVRSILSALDMTPEAALEEASQLLLS